MFLDAVEVEHLEDASAGHHPDARAVGDRRRRRHILLLLPVIAAAERPLPGNSPTDAVHAPQLQIIADLNLQVFGDAGEDARR